MTTLRARRGKKFAVALAKEKELDDLKEFEPHIVRSKYVPGKLFCRITGRYVQAWSRTDSPPLQLPILSTLDGG